MTRRTRRLPLMVSCGLLFPWVGACLDDPTDDPAPPEVVREYTPTCVQVAGGQGYASEATFPAVVAAEKAGTVIVDDTLGPLLITPKLKFLSTTAPPSFRFTVAPLAANTPPAAPSPSPGTPGLWDRLVSSVVPTVRAQTCPPLTGDNYLLRIWDHRAGKTNIRSLDTPVYTAVLGEPVLVPDGDLWRQRFRGRFSEFNVEILRVVFRDGQVVAGPYKRSVRPRFETLPDDALAAVNGSSVPPEQDPIDPPPDEG